MSQILRAKHPEVEFELQISSSTHSGSVHLKRCRSKSMGSGAGSAFMRDLAFYADAEGVSLGLLIGSHPGNPISARGQALLESLHPDCEDPDLPYRLDTWVRDGEASLPAMDRYIRTFFGKQLRFSRSGT